jgi:hypothetical protein
MQVITRRAQITAAAFVQARVTDRPEGKGPCPDPDEPLMLDFFFESAIVLSTQLTLMSSMSRSSVVELSFDILDPELQRLPSGFLQAL